jgi:hypothetical protein
LNSFYYIIVTKYTKIIKASETKKLSFTCCPLRS